MVGSIFYPECVEFICIRNQKLKPGTDLNSPDVQRRKGLHLGSHSSRPKEQNFSSGRCHLSLSCSLALYWEGSGWRQRNAVLLIACDVYMEFGWWCKRDGKQDLRERRAGQGHPKALTISSLLGEGLTSSSFIPPTSLIDFSNCHEAYIVHRVCSCTASYPPLPHRLLFYRCNKTP